MAERREDCEPQMERIDLRGGIGTYGELTMTCDHGYEIRIPLVGDEDENQVRRAVIYEAFRYWHIQTGYRGHPEAQGPA